MSPTNQLRDLLERADREQWRVYSYDAGDWMPTGSAVDSLVEARGKQVAFTQRHGLLAVVVRETVTYQIEEPP